MHAAIAFGSRGSPRARSPPRLDLVLELEGEGELDDGVQDDGVDHAVEAVGVEGVEVESLVSVHFVRRDKSWIFCGCKSHPANWIAPAGSYRSDGGGNEAVGAFETMCRIGDAARGQVVTRVNVEQASKRQTWVPTRQNDGEGCH
jgi:hypothetical protein